MKMNCIDCNQPAKKFGKHRNGLQRYRCAACKKTFTEPQEKPLGDMTLAEEKAISVLQHLVEGCSIRTTSRITGVHPRTILSLLTLAGERCERLMTDRIQGLRVRDVQCDELWGYVGMKEKTKARKGSNDATIGDAWTFVAIERHSKLVLAWHLGRRTERDTEPSRRSWQQPPQGSFQVTTDGFAAYRDAVVLSLGAQGVDFAQLVKLYAANPENEIRYSPARMYRMQKSSGVWQSRPGKDQHVACGAPEPHNANANAPTHPPDQRILEEVGKTLRYALPLLRVVQLLSRPPNPESNPAMEAGIASHVWEIKELLHDAR